MSPADYAPRPISARTTTRDTEVPDALSWLVLATFAALFLAAL